MKNKLISLLDIISLIDDESLSEKYVRYIAGLDNDDKYRHQEIRDISALVNELKVGNKYYEGFIYSYKIPFLNKEFDLLKITQNKCINIELKSDSIPESRIEKQLKQNFHYLSIIGKELFVCTFVSSDRTLYRYDGKELSKCDIKELKDVLIVFDIESVDLDLLFTPKKVLVSPLNSPEDFIDGKYLLTEHQQTIKQKVIDYIQNNADARFVGITGGPGTGKTLLIYDIAKELAKKNDVLIIHSGIMCEGHLVLNARIKRLKIIEAKEIRYREFKGTNYVIVDESHRLYPLIIDSIIKWVQKSKTTCIFSYDASQKLSKFEDRINNALKIQSLCSEDTIFKLTNRIRTNKEIALFIECLFDLSKYRPEYVFENVSIIYEPDERNAVRIAKSKEDYTYISYTPSKYFASLDYQKTSLTTHKVIGQEFDNVVMVINSYFEYDGKKLKSKEHPNPDYIFVQLLFQGLTRARNKLLLIITNRTVLNNVLGLFRK